MVTGRCRFGAYAADHACQAFRPIAGAEGLTGSGHTENHNFFGRVTLHRFILGVAYFIRLTSNAL